MLSYVIMRMRRHNANKVGNLARQVLKYLATEKAWYTTSRNISLSKIILFNCDTLFHVATIAATWKTVLRKLLIPTRRWWLSVTLGTNEHCVVFAHIPENKTMFIDIFSVLPLLIFFSEPRCSVSWTTHYYSSFHSAVCILLKMYIPNATSNH